MSIFSEISKEHIVFKKERKPDGYNIGMNCGDAQDKQ